MEPVASMEAYRIIDDGRERDTDTEAPLYDLRFKLRQQPTITTEQEFGVDIFKQKNARFK